MACARGKDEARRQEEENNEVEVGAEWGKTPSSTCSCSQLIAEMPDQSFIGDDLTHSIKQI